MRVKLLTPNRGAEIEVEHDQVEELLAKGFHRVDPLAGPVGASVEEPEPEPETDEPEPESPVTGPWPTIESEE